MRRIREHRSKRLLFLTGILAFGFTALNAERLMENIDRGVVAVRTSADSSFVSWRLLKSDPDNISFDVYRSDRHNNAKKLNTLPVSHVTFFIDSQCNLSESFTYSIVRSGTKPFEEQGSTCILKADTLVKPYLTVPLQIPPSTFISGRENTYSANDASVADLDGDGANEIILKWQPSFVRNPPQKGLTGEQIIDAYKLDGTLLWRINLGKNIRSGAAYTQFLVYDFDGDGKAEMICKTADGTVDGTGNIIGNPDKDWRTLDQNSPMYGKIVDGPEYLTVFDGKSGRAVATENYIPDRYPLDGWGGIGGNGNNDRVGSRADRFSAGVAYLDGHLPCAVFVRGWYGRTAVAAWDFRNGKLSLRWLFDSNDEDNPYSGQGNHSVSVGDFDGDGKDEFCVGAMTVDDDGKGLYTTGLRHGDALHISDLDPERPGQEVFGIHENEGKTVALKTPGVAMFDAASGEIIWSIGPGVDVGRGVAADIDPRYSGCENWGGPGGLRDVHGKTISEKAPRSTNFVVWWDGDLSRELLDDNHIDKWDWKNSSTINLLTADECHSNNGTKATPCLSGDILGDWREEVIWRTADSRELHIYTTTMPTRYRFVSLMQDPQYRLSIAWQNVAYNQPPHPGFYLGSGMKPVDKQ
ncbi:rhamnogalacturonan lyase [Saccharicrinis sp. FJH54]|uniref:rhamnogalacturonan lyase n=1 Tax=Saccharicrinis sp. FJH54 TaxID=3344665 RepID=UPI0035D41A2A